MRTLLTLCLSLCVACAASRPAVVSPRSPHVAQRGEEFRVVGATERSPGDAYDAALLFDRAVAAMRAQRCDDALVDLDRLVREFPDASVWHVAQYNRGLCLQRARRWPDAVDAMRAASRTERDAALVRDARFRVAAVGESAERPEWVIESTDALLASTTLSITDRVEANARRAAALLARGDLDAAELTASEAARVAPTPEAVSALDDDTWAARARFVLAEVSRLRAAAITWRVEDADSEQKITRRVQLVTRAHAQYNETIRVGNPEWAAASGFSIGEAYRALYDAIVDAPTPDAWGEPEREAYRRRAGERLRRSSRARCGAGRPPSRWRGATASPTTLGAPREVRRRAARADHGARQA
ncbi:MAG: hypothetical protein R3A52_14680 [Polyangiales bacterium]